MHITTNGLVIGAAQVREGDKFLTVLTDGEGKIRVSAKGAAKGASRLLAASQLFAFSRMTLFEDRGKYRLDGAAPVAQFHGLSEDVTRLALASYFAELLGALTEAGEECREIFQLATSALYVLSAGTRPEPLIKAAFEMRLMALSGYEPELTDCAVCGGEPIPAFFDPEKGMLCCGACAEGQEGFSAVPLSPGALDAMRFLVSAEIRRIFSFSLGDSSMDALGRVAEAYVLSRTERRFKTLDFYKSLLIHEDIGSMRNIHE